MNGNGSFFYGTKKRSSHSSSSVVQSPFFIALSLSEPLIHISLPPSSFSRPFFPIKAAARFASLSSSFAKREKGGKGGGQKGGVKL